MSPSTPLDADKLLARNPLPPPPLSAIVVYIVGSSNVPLESSLSFSGLHGAHCHVDASSSLLVDVNTTCMNSNITSNKYFFQQCRPVAYDVSWLLHALLLGVWSHSGAVWRRRPPWFIGFDCILPSFLSRTQTTSPPNQSLTKNQPPIQPKISTNNTRAFRAPRVPNWSP